MQRVRTRAVRLKARQAVELEPSVVLPPGYYSATKVRTGLETTSGVSWAAPQFTIEFTADQLASMGAKVALNLISMKIDVTTLVRDGKLTQG